MYNGSGPVLMGYISPHVLRADLISSIREHAVDSSETVPYKVARGILEKVEPDTAVADILKALGVTETSGLSVASVQKLTAVCWLMKLRNVYWTPLSPALCTHTRGHPPTFLSLSLSLSLYACVILSLCVSSTYAIQMLFFFFFHLLLTLQCFRCFFFRTAPTERVESLGVYD